MWREFFIFGYRIVAKAYDNPSAFGIEGAKRVSKIAIYHGEDWVLNYDRGWDFNHLPEWVLNPLITALDHIL